MEEERHVRFLFLCSKLLQSQGAPHLLIIYWLLLVRSQAQRAWALFGISRVWNQDVLRGTFSSGPYVLFSVPTGCGKNSALCGCRNEVLVFLLALLPVKESPQVLGKWPSLIWQLTSGEPAEESHSRPLTGVLCYLLGVTVPSPLSYSVA